MDTLSYRKYKELELCLSEFPVGKENVWRDSQRNSKMEEIF